MQQHLLIMVIPWMGVQDILDSTVSSLNGSMQQKIFRANQLHKEVTEESE